MDEGDGVARGAGYAAFERSVRRVVERRTGSIDATWWSLSQWVDKFFHAHDAATLADDAAQLMKTAPAVDSPQAPVRLSRACLVLDECLSLLGKQFRTVEGVANWARDEIFRWLFVDPTQAIDNRLENTVFSAEHHIDSGRVVHYSTKTYRHVLRHASARLPETAMVEFSESLKEALLRMISQRHREVSHKFVGVCFRQWRRHVSTKRRGRFSAAAMAETAAKDMAKRLEDELMLADERNDDLMQHLDTTRRALADAHGEIERLTAELEAVQRPPPPDERLRASVREVASLEMKLEQLHEDLSAVKAHKVYPAIGLPLPAPGRQTSATALATAFLTLHAKKTPVDFASIAEVVSAYAHALHARCPTLATKSRLDAIVLPDSLAIRRTQLGRLVDTHFGLSPDVLDAAVVSGDPTRHVQPVTQLLIAGSRAMRRTVDDPAHVEAAIRHQLEYAAVLEILLLTGPAVAAAPAGDP